MKIIISSDEHTHLVDAVIENLKKRGYNIEFIGPHIAGTSQDQDWPEVTLQAVEKVANGTADEAIVMCWTGTGCSLIANKIPGIRAALCHDAETAKGARIRNHANVLALSLRATSEALVNEILDAWFATPYSRDTWNLKQIARIKDIEEKYSREK